MRREHFSYIFSILLLCAGILTGCGSVATPAVTATPVSQSTPTRPAPTATVLPDQVWWIQPGEDASIPSDQLRQTAQKLANQSGWEFVEKPSVSQDEITAGGRSLKAILILPPSDGLVDIATANSGVPFISVGIAGLPEAPNLYRVAPLGSHPEWISYLAGYLAATVTDEWRIGMLTEATSEDAIHAGNAFYDGGVMFCGLCNPEFPPYTDYPLVQNVDQDHWQTDVDAFLQQKISTAYIYPDLATPELLQYLVQNNTRLITSSQPISGSESAWIAVIQSDLTTPLQSAWQDAIAGNPPGIYSEQIQVISEDPKLVTPGKLQWLQQVIADLTNGNLIP